MPDPAPKETPPQPRVCVVGSLNMDLVVRAPRIPTPGETVLGSGYRTYPGGKGANQAVAAARGGAKVSIIGCVGDDLHGGRLKEALEKEGLHLSGLTQRTGIGTGLALITVAEDGENAIVVSPGANAEVSGELVEASRALIETCDVLLMQLEVPNAAVAAAATIARSAGAAVILNGAPARILPREILQTIDVLVVNRVEAARLLGMDASVDGARLALRLPELGPQTAVLTLGPQGAIVAHRGRPRRIPTVAVRPIDTVGAGDAFCGTLAAWWQPVHEAGKKRDAREFELVEQALIAASVAGSLATTRHGGIPAMPQRDEVIAAMHGLRAQ